MPSHGAPQPIENPGDGYYDVTTSRISDSLRSSNSLPPAHPHTALNEDIFRAPDPETPPISSKHPDLEPVSTLTVTSSSSSSSASSAFSPSPTTSLSPSTRVHQYRHVLPPYKIDELENDHLLPEGWKKHAEKDVFYNLLTGRETSNRPIQGQGGVVYVEGLLSLDDLTKHVSSFSVEQFEQWLNLNEETISSAPPQLKSIEEEFESWTAETGEEEELIPWLLGEQIKLFFSISETLFSSFLPLPKDEKQWESHFKLNDDKLISEKIETLLQNSSSSSSIDQLIKIFLQNPDQVKILVEVIKVIFKSQVMMTFIPNKCRFAHESISIQVPFDRICHKNCYSRIKTKPHFCRIIFPAVLGEGNDERLTKALVAR